jgi:hypothetical protein
LSATAERAGWESGRRSEGVRLDVVDADVIAEDGARIGVGLLDRRASEADERRIRQRVAQIARESVDQVVLAAVRFIGDHDDVAALR